MSGEILIIGGGIAGISAALNAADYGKKVYLIDDTPSIGGIMARLDKTFPTNDCSICIEAPKMYEVENHPLIEIMTNTELKRIRKKGKGFQVVLQKRARFIDEERCTGCGKCIEVCPVLVDDELDGKIGGKRKLIYMPFPQAVPNVVVLDPDCRYGKRRKDGACIGGCVVDCSQCRECPIALCVKACLEEGKDAVRLWQSNKNIRLEVDSVIISSGLSPSEPPKGLFGYGIYQNVITNMHFERLMNAGGPTGGIIKRPSDGAHPKRVAWIQCANRGLKEGLLPYCSKVCCMISNKQTIISKEHDPEMETTIFNMDLTAYGKGFYDFYRKAVSMGVRYIRAKPFAVSEIPESKNLILSYEDPEQGKVVDKEVDLLVLATGLIPSDRNQKLSKVLGIGLNELGFFKEKDSLDAPLESEVEGIYLCGGALGPIDISESVVQAMAAALKAVIYSDKDRGSA